MCEEITRDMLKICYFSENIIINFTTDAISMERKSDLPDDTIKRILRSTLGMRPGDAVMDT